MTRVHPFRPTTHRSLWLEEALAAEPEAEQVDPLAGDHRADVCVVGGGYTGLWTALRLKELDPALSVTLLEADLCGSGASGRNGGFTQGWWPKLTALAALCGEEEAMRLCREAEAAVGAIGAFCTANGIDAHHRRGGWLWTATTPLHVGKWEAAVAACERRGVDAFVRLTPDEVAARTGSPVHLAGVLEKSTATVQPALLARGLRRVAVERGVRVFERSPMTELRHGPRPTVRTDRGSVVAERVVLATNAWAADLPQLRRDLIVISSDMVATAPIPERLAELGWTGGEAITDARMMVAYYRTTRDGRIAFGRGSGGLGFRSRVLPSFDHDRRRAAEVAADLRRLYPALADVPITHAWGGAVDRTENGLPSFAPVGGDGRVLAAIGYSGNGVGPAYLGGRFLAHLALGLRDEWTASPLTRPVARRFPPEPFRYVGGRLVRAAVARKEKTEEAGRPPDVLTRRLAALAPSGMVKGGRPATPVASKTAIPGSA